MTTLLDLPGELVCKIFEQLPSLLDMVALRSSRLAFLRVYLRYEKQLRKHQQDKLLYMIQGYLERWIRANTNLPGPYQRFPRVHSDVKMEFPEDTWNISRQKNSFTKYVLDRMAVIAGLDGRIRDWSVYGSCPMDWRRPADWHWYKVTEQEEYSVADCLGLAVEDVISLAREGYVILYPAGAKIIWGQRSKFVVCDAKDFLEARDPNRVPYKVVAVYDRGELVFKSSVLDMKVD